MLGMYASRLVLGTEKQQAHTPNVCKAKACGQDWTAVPLQRGGRCWCVRCRARKRGVPAMLFLHRRDLGPCTRKGARGAVDAPKGSAMSCIEERGQRLGIGATPSWRQIALPRPVGSSRWRGMNALSPVSV
jgi:hypothetical protein